MLLNAYPFQPAEDDHLLLLRIIPSDLSPFSSCLIQIVRTACTDMKLSGVAALGLVAVPEVLAWGGEQPSRAAALPPARRTLRAY